MTGLPGLRDGRIHDRGWLERGPLAQALAALNGEGEETRVVGGAVRDLALGLSPGDFDLATTALPEEVMRRARRAGFKVIPTGLSHGTVTLLVAGQPIETTTLREDVETDGRHAKVVFGRDFHADARRRDITINALSLDRQGFVHDPVGGLADLAARRVRFIGDADLRIREDFLRILRFFRFSARFGGGALDAQGLSAAIRNRDGIERLSRERVRAELFKLVVAPHTVPVVRAMGECGFLEPIFAGMAYPGRFGRLVLIERARAQQADAFLRLMALAIVTAEDGERLRERLRLTNAERKRAIAAAKALETLHGIDQPPSARELDILSFAVGRDPARDALRLAEASSKAGPDDAAFAEADRHLRETSLPIPPFAGRDVLARGVPPGPQVGRVMQAFQGMWLASGLPADSETLDRLLTAAIDAATRPG